MNEHEKLEKVIMGLEMSYTYSNVDGSNTLVPQQLVLDALALLKAQEPRVMTPEDFENNPNVDQYGCLPCWMEYREEPKWDGWAEATVHTCVEYGRRPWTSRPTDKQMEAVKWE